MVDNKQIRIGDSFYHIITFIKAKELLAGREEPSMPLITEKMVKYIDKEKFWENEFNA